MNPLRSGIALGSNLGDRVHQLREATRALIAMHHGPDPVRCSSIYQTEPRFCPPGSPVFLNAVVEILWPGSPSDLHRQTRAIESRLGREASDIPNAPRIIDVDILYCGGHILDTPELRLPHPRIHERRFVLTPLAEIRPELVLPNRNQSIAALLAQISNDEPIPNRLGDLLP